MTGERRREVDGRYARELPCDACGKPVKPDAYESDTEICGSTDGPGFMLCDRKRCVGKRDAMSVEARRAYYVKRR